MCCEQTNKKELEKKLFSNRKKLEKNVKEGNETICDIIAKFISGESNIISAGVRYNEFED